MMGGQFKVHDGGPPHHPPCAHLCNIEKYDLHRNPILMNHLGGDNKIHFAPAGFRNKMKLFLD